MVVITSLIVNMVEKINKEKRNSIKKKLIIGVLGALSFIPFVSSSPYLFRDGGVDSFEISKDGLDAKNQLLKNVKGFTEELDSASGSTFVFGDLGVMTSTGIIKTNASAIATTKGQLFIALETIGSASTGLWLISGTLTTTGLTKGDQLFMSETPGVITATAPTTSGSQVRIVGYSFSTTKLFFNPGNTYVEAP